MWAIDSRRCGDVRKPYRACLVVSAMILVIAGASAARIPAKILTLHKGRAGYYSIRVQYPRFIGSSAVPNKANTELSRKAQTLFAGSLRETIDALKTVGQPTSPYSFGSVPTVSLSRPDVISVYYTNTSFTGGAHPDWGYTSANFGLVKGFAKRLSLADLFKPGVDARKIAGQQVYNRLKSDPGAMWIKQGTIAAASGELTSTFVITSAGLSFLIAPYDVGPYSSGSFTVKVPWSAFGANLNRDGPLKPLLESH